MATGGSSAEPEPLGALDMGPRALGPGGRLLGIVRVGGGGQPAPGPGPGGPWPMSKAPKGSGSALEPPSGHVFSQERYRNHIK